MHLVILFRHLGSLFRHLGHLFRQLVNTAASQECVQASREVATFTSCLLAPQNLVTQTGSLQCYARTLLKQVHFVPDASTYGGCL